MKTDLERICEVARMGGLRCEVFYSFGAENPFCFRLLCNDQAVGGEIVKATDALVRPEMLRALDNGMMASGVCAYVENPFGNNGKVVSFVYADDRIAWVIKNVVEPIERQVEGKTDKVRVGDFVKIRSHGERFWCKVQRVSEFWYQCVVDNKLVIAPFKHGESISVLREDVIEHMQAKEDGGEHGL